MLSVDLRLNIYKVFLSLVFIFLFLAPLSRAFLPDWLNGVGVISIMLLAGYFLVKHVVSFPSRVVVSIILILIIFSLLSFFILGENLSEMQVWSFFIILLLAFAIEKGIIFFIKPVKFFLFLNLIALVWEKISGQYIIPVDVDMLYGYGEKSVYFYGQGLFSYTKDGAEFLAISILLFRNDTTMKLIIFISTLFVGVRAAIIVVLVIIVIDFMLIMRPNSKTIYSIVLILFFALLINTLISHDGYIYTGKYSSALASDSSAYTSRIYIVNKHLECYANIPLFQQLFGSGFYCSRLYAWGSESFPVQILTYYGLFLFSLYLSMILTIIFFTFKDLKNFSFFYPFIVILLVGIVVRFPIGWFGGSIFFSLVFQSLLNKKQWNINLSKLRLKK